MLPPAPATASNSVRFQARCVGLGGPSLRPPSSRFDGSPCRSIRTARGRSKAKAMIVPSPTGARTMPGDSPPYSPAGYRKASANTLFVSRHVEAIPTTGRLSPARPAMGRPARRRRRGGSLFAFASIPAARASSPVGNMTTAVPPRCTYASTAVPIGPGSGTAPAGRISTGLSCGSSVPSVSGFSVDQAHNPQAFRISPM